MTTYSNPGAIADVVTNTKVESTWGNAIRDRVVNNYATAAARTAAIVSPVVGQMCVIDNDATATLALQQYVGATMTWVAPWNLPWGRVASASVSSDQGSITTVVDVTSLTATWTAVANRRYKISVKLISTNTLIDTLTTYTVTDSSNVIKDTVQSRSVAAAGNGDLVAWCYEETGISAGSNTRKVRALAAAGTTTVKGTIGTGYIIVEDIGPSGAPS